MNYITRFILSGILTTFCIASAAFAEIKSFIKEYTYTASEIDSKVSSRAIALEQVKRLLLEELGTYLISETEVKNYQLTKDQVGVLTAGIVKTEILQEKWDGTTYYMKAKIAADPEQVTKSVNDLRADKQKTKELEETRAKANYALAEIERLKNEISDLKQSTGSQKKYAAAVKALSAADWFDKGYSFIIAGNYKEALNAFGKAIELNPQSASAYNNRGTAYSDLGKYQEAIDDYNKAIELNPQTAGIYINRGNTYKKFGSYQQAVDDFSRAIELSPQSASAYGNRGLAYDKLGRYQQAIEDYNKTIELKPHDAEAYHTRGIIYAHLGNYSQALRDSSKAIKLNPQHADAYMNRGKAHAELGSYQKALKDCDKAIELNPQNAVAYLLRGYIYSNLKKEQKAIQDIKIAARLGDKSAQDMLTQRKIAW